MLENIVRLPAFEVVGFTTRTNNALEMSGQGRIGPLWHTFMENAEKTLPGVIDHSLTFSIYTNYESDQTGAYDVILGKPASNLNSVPEGLRGIAIPAADYLVFPADSPTPEAIQAAWMAVYEYFAGRTNPRRAFTADFERYSADGIHLYIAV
jgi:predicted transcriptional regulator YdeE